MILAADVSIKVLPGFQPLEPPFRLTDSEKTNELVNASPIPILTVAVSP
jgi:hypothetical protein